MSEKVLAIITLPISVIELEKIAHVFSNSGGNLFFRSCKDHVEIIDIPLESEPNDKKQDY